jgi:hypothetical protein
MFVSSVPGIFFPTIKTQVLVWQPGVGVDQSP